MTRAKNLLSSLSVFLPCYNEEANLKNVVSSLYRFLPEVTSESEIIIVDDGSTDSTGNIAEDLAKELKHVKVIHHDKNLGYGMALRTGYAAATKDWVFFTDADSQFDVTELKKFIPFTPQYHVLIGYRLHRAEGGLRALNARLFKLFIDLLFRVHVKDIDCAFKLIKTSVVRQIKFHSTGAMISSELLYRLKKMGEPFKQIPVTHYPRKFGKPTGNNFKVVLKAGFEALKLYLYMKFGISLT